MKSDNKHPLNKLWSIFQKRKDIEYSFVVSVCTGMLILVLVLMTGTNIFRDVLIGPPLLVGWFAFTTYFLLSIKSYKKSK